MKNPTKPGIYPVFMSNGEHTCARWDGSCWRLWTTVWDPHEWDVAEQLNVSIAAWRHPSDAFQPGCPDPMPQPKAET